MNRLKTSRPKDNDCSPESNMPRRSNIIFSAIKAGNSKVNSPLWPNFEHMWDFMPAQVICKFHKDPKKNERTMSWTMSSMAFFNNQGQITLKCLVWSGQNSNSSEIICLSRLPASLTKIRSIMNVLAWRNHFPIIVYGKFFQCSRARNTDSHYKSMGAFGCHIYHSFVPVCPKNLMQPFPTLMMLRIKFDQDWPTGHRDIHVWKCKYIRIFFGAQGHVTPKWLIRSGRN